MPVYNLDNNANGLIGSQGDDTIRGFGGNDTLWGNGAFTYDIIEGGSGDDVIYQASPGFTSPGWVAAYGQAGNDTLHGGQSGDILDGGEGDDRIVGNLDGDNNTDNDVINGGAGNDTLIGGGGRDTIYGDDGNDLIENAAGAFQGTAFRGIGGVIYGGSGNDRIGWDTNFSVMDIVSIYGEAGDDIIRREGERSYIDGGEGADTIIAGFGADTITGGWDDAADSIEGGHGNDLLTGGGGNDTLRGGQGADTLDGGAGTDLLDGGQGDDTYLFTSPAPLGLHQAFSEITESADGGHDRIRIHVPFAYSVLPSHVEEIEVLVSPSEFIQVLDDAASGPTAHRMIGHDGANTFLATGGNDTLIGNGGHDLLVGGDHDDRLEGGAGNDTLYGDAYIAAGGGIISSQPGHDWLEGGEGDDRLLGGAGRDTLFGGAGSDLLLGNEDNDFLYGDAGADSLVGGDGDDRLFGDAGYDTVEGGSGNDELWVGPDGGIMRGGAGSDIYQLWDGPTVVEDPDFSSHSADELRGGLTQQTSLVLRSQAHGPVQLYAGLTISGIERLNLFTSMFDDVFDLRGFGESGQHRFTNTGGRDTFFDEWRPRWITWIDPGLGPSDEVVSFDFSAATVGILSFLWVEDFPEESGLVRQTVTRSLIAGDSGIVMGDYAEDLAGDRFIVTGSSFADQIIVGMGHDAVLGGVGNDTIEGNEGDDTLDGGAGDDHLLGGLGSDFLNGGGGADLMDGGAGFDTVAWFGSNAGVTVNLLNQALNAGGAARDVAHAFEVYYLTSFNDRFTNGDAGGFVYGFGGDDALIGGRGADFFVGGLGADTIEGGDGFDYASYGGAAAGITLNLQTAAHTGEAAGDVMTGIEAFFLTGYDDLFVGKNGPGSQHIVFGGGGGDLLRGGDLSNDWLFGEAGGDTLVGGSLDDLLAGGQGADGFRFLSWVGNGVDSILDYNRAEGDRIELVGAGFGRLTGQAFTAGVDFVAGANPFAASTAGTMLYYNSGPFAGLLYFDPDGSGGALPIGIAQLLGGPQLQASDFIIL